MSQINLVSTAAPTASELEGLKRENEELFGKTKKQHELIIMKSRILQKKDELIETLLRDEAEKMKIKEQEMSALYQALHDLAIQLNDAHLQEKQVVMRLETEVDRKDIALEERKVELARLRLEHSTSAENRQRAELELVKMQTHLEQHKLEVKTTTAMKVAEFERTLEEHKQQIDDISQAATDKVNMLEAQLLAKQQEAEKHRRNAAHTKELELRSTLMQCIVDKDLQGLQIAIQNVDENMPEIRSCVEYIQAQDLKSSLENLTSLLESQGVADPAKKYGAGPLDLSGGPLSGGRKYSASAVTSRMRHELNIPSSVRELDIPDASDIEKQIHEELNADPTRLFRRQTHTDVAASFTGKLSTHGYSAAKGKGAAAGKAHKAAQPQNDGQVMGMGPQEFSDSHGATTGFVLGQHESHSSGQHAIPHALPDDGRFFL